MDGEGARALPRSKVQSDVAAEAVAGESPDQPEQYEYCLFVAGASARSQMSIKTVRTVCDLHLKGRYNFVVVDVFDDPDRAEFEQVYITPTLIRYRPPPPCRIIGDFSSEVDLASKMELTG